MVAAAESAFLQWVPGWLEAAETKQNCAFRVFHTFRAFGFSRSAAAHS